MFSSGFGFVIILCVTILLLLSVDFIYFIDIYSAGILLFYAINHQNVFFLIWEETREKKKKGTQKGLFGP